MYFIKANTNGLEQSALNWDMASALLLLFASYILSSALGEAYWVYYIKKIKLDERQREMRRKIFEKSYTVLAVLALGGLLLLPGILNQLTRVSQEYPLEIPLFQVVLYIYSLPSVIATWSKNS
jgi:hypothetical protein